MNARQKSIRLTALIVIASLMANIATTTTVQASSLYTTSPGVGVSNCKTSKTKFWGYSYPDRQSKVSFSKGTYYCFTGQEKVNGRTRTLFEVGGVTYYWN